MSRSETGKRIAVRGRDGGAAVVRQHGAGDLPHVLIHGFAEGSYVWNDLIANLVPLPNLYTVDLRGHGDSDWDPDGRYETAQHVQDILHIVDALGLERFVLIGHSLGGKVAARVAALCEGRVVGLVVVDTEPTADPAAKAHVGAALKASLRRYDSVAEYAEYLVATRPLASPRLLAQLAECALRRREDRGFELKADPRLAEAYPREENGKEIWDSLAAVKCPALIVRGAYSGILSSTSAKRVVSCMRQAALETVAAAGHSVMIDNPEGFRRALEPFLRRLHGAPALRAQGAAGAGRSGPVLGIATSLISFETDSHVYPYPERFVES